LKKEIARTGAVATTDAVRRPDDMTATSPMTSPGPTSRTFVPSTETSTVPSSISSIEWPKSPSDISASPAA
jgi:hypothetical protein